MGEENIYSAEARLYWIHCSQYYFCQIASINVVVQFCLLSRDKSSFNTAQKQSAIYSPHILCPVAFLTSLPVDDVDKACV